MTKARDIASATPAPSTVSSTELGYLDGVTSAIQTQIDGKQAVNANVSTTELGYLDGVTSAIQTQLDGKIAKTLTTTTGDIIYASSANTPARLGIGSSGQVLTVASGIPSWAAAAAGGMTLINSGGTNLAGSQTTTVSVGSGYIDLHIYVTNWYRNDGQLFIYFNSDTTSTNYNSSLARSYNDANGAFAPANNPSLSAAGVNSSSTGYNFHSIRVPFYNDTTIYKTANVFGTSLTPANDRFIVFGNVLWRSNSAITSVSISNDTGNFSGGKVYVYGVK